MLVSPRTTADGGIAQAAVAPAHGDLVGTEVPSRIVVLPVKVFAPVTRQKAAAGFIQRSEVGDAAVDDHPRYRIGAGIGSGQELRILLPAPVAVKAAAFSTSAPEPELSMVAPPVVPARLITAVRGQAGADVSQGA